MRKMEIQRDEVTGLRAKSWDARPGYLAPEMHSESLNLIASM